MRGQDTTKPAAAEDIFPESSLVWIPDTQAMFVPARVLASFSAGQPGRVALLDDTGDKPIFELELDATVTAHSLIRMDEESLRAPKQDMVDLKELNDASILHNLRKRFLTNDVYTTIGEDVLVAVNPFKLLPIYTPLVVDQYVRHSASSSSSAAAAAGGLQPHIFRSADEAFARLMHSKRDQACMVTGESGSGKTETTKLFLQYLAEVSASWSSTSPQQSTPTAASSSLDQTFLLSDRILKSNPLLESFGNAVTRKNHNSSRFGKMIAVNIAPQSGEIASAKTTIFLLEKSRLPIQEPGERNFHIFYQLCAAAGNNAQIQQRYEVPDAEECRYLAYSSRSTSPLVNDLVGFDLVQRSMTVLNFSPQVQGEIFSLVSAVLHLGNLDFCEDDAILNCEASRIHSKSMPTLQCVARLLGLPDVSVLHSNLCYKSVQAGGKEAVKQPQSVDRSRKSRDALAIHIYTCLFEFVAHQVNHAQQQQHATASTPVTKSIAILDIFGFEAFDAPDVNSFEQMCIDYCNEKLQGQFNDVMFAREKLEYERENLSTALNFHDMQHHTHQNTLAVLELFERPRHGLFALLDEECSVPGGTDQSFLKKLTQENRSSAVYSAGKKAMVDTTFVVRHYVGSVVYTVRNFLEKNDGGFLSKDLHTLCLTSSLSVLASAAALASSSSTATATNNNNNAKWHLASQFANQLDLLVRELSEMYPAFVRCIKPNSQFTPGGFNSIMVLDQLRCSGILEVCRIRQLGFPVRRAYGDFHARYWAVLAPPTANNNRPAAGNAAGSNKNTLDDKHVKAMLRLPHLAWLLPPGQFACGKTKVFLSNGCYGNLELALAKLRTIRATRIQRRFRAFFARKWYRAVQHALHRLRHGMAEENAEEMQLALAELRKSWWPSSSSSSSSKEEDSSQGRHLPVVQQAWKQLSAMEELRWSLGLITRAVLSKDGNQIRSALACTTTIVPQTHDTVVQAKLALDALVQRDALVLRINDLVASPTATAAELHQLLQLAIPPSSGAQRFPVDAFTLERAKAKLARLEEQEKASATAASASAAPASTRLAMLDPSKQAAMLDALRGAVRQRDPLLIARQLVELFQHGLESHPEAQSALELERELQQDVQSSDELRQLELVLERKQGDVSESDLVLVDNLIASATTSSSSGGGGGTRRHNSTLRIKAERVAEDARERMEAQQGMVHVLDKLDEVDYAQVRAALERAYACGLKTGETVYRVQKLMRTKNRTRRMGRPHRVVIDVQGPVPEKLSKHVGLIRSLNQTERDGGQALIAEALEAGDQYLLPNYYLVRAPDAPARTRIQCQGARVLERTILDSPMAAVASSSSGEGGVGEMVSKLILGYTGEKSAAFPATCATGLLELGMRNADVGDEIYCQICAHLTENTSSESATRTWQLMCLAIGTFYPSGDLLFFIIRFLVDRAEGRTDASLPALAQPKPKLATTLDTYTLEQRYALYALRRLQHDLSNEVVCQSVPGMEEILAYGERVPLVTNITFPDGMLLMEDMLISPLMTCHDVAALCLEQVGISQVEMGPSYGLFARPVDRGTYQAVAAAAAAAASSSTAAAAAEVVGEEEAGSSSNSPSRFRLSITAVFGLAKAGGAAVRRRSSALLAAVSSPSSPTSAASSSARRTEDELEWDLPLLPSDHVSDVLLRYLRAGRGAPRLVFKKRIFVPEFEKLAEELRVADDTDGNRITALAMQRIELLQAMDDFSTGALPFDREDDVVDLVACRVALKFDNRLPANDAERLMQIGQVELLVPATWRARKTEINWSRALLEKKTRVNGRDTDALQDMILKKCQARPLFGMQLFRVVVVAGAEGGGGGATSILACSKLGFTLITPKEYKVQGEFRFDQLQEYAVTRSHVITLKKKSSSEGDGETTTTTLHSPHAKEIVEIAREYEGVAQVLDALGSQEKKLSSPQAAASSSPQAAASSSPQAAATTPSHQRQQPQGKASTIYMPRKATTTNSAHRGSVAEGGPAASSDEAFAAAANHSLREQMEKLGASESDISQVLRLAVPTSGQGGAPPVDRLRTKV